MADAFNLLQMYQDDDDDDESHQIDTIEETQSTSSAVLPDNTTNESNLNDVVNRQSSPTPQVVINSAAIVDYAHDDVAMSPEHKEGEILGASTGRVIFGEELGSMREVQQRTPIVNVQTITPNNVGSSPQVSDQVDVPDVNNIAANISDMEVRESVEVLEVDSENVDPLDNFLPPPPKEKCSDELQEKINKFLAYKRQGKSFNVEVRNRKDYRNPDFLRHAVRYQDIDEIGSCFSKDVFDPHGYDESDFYDAIETAINRERERKEQERKKSQKVEFVSGATPAGSVGITPKVMLPSPGNSIMPSGGLQSGSADSLPPRDGRQNKKSKWDKVDGDRRSLLSGGHENVSAAAAHAALLSAANAGAGYAVYAQQKRREAEERRSSDRKFEKRS